MSAEESQAFNLSINGCARMLVFVLSSYSFRASLKMACKSEEDEFDAVEVVLDMSREGWDLGWDLSVLCWQCAEAAKGVFR